MQDTLPNLCHPTRNMSLVEFSIPPLGFLPIVITLRWGKCELPYKALNWK